LDRAPRRRRIAARQRAREEAARRRRALGRRGAHYLRRQGRRHGAAQLVEPVDGAVAQSPGMCVRGRDVAAAVVLRVVVEAHRDAFCMFKVLGAMT
jgi:hypothetical protein